MPVFTHILVLREGKVVAAGPKEQVLTSAVLRKAFGARLRLKSAGGRYTLDVSPSRRVVI